MKSPQQFAFSHEPPPHRARCKRILAAHPEIRQLVGRKTPWTIWIIVAAVLLQIVVAWQLRHAEWGPILLAAYVVGAFASHTLFVCIHEATHSLIFRTRSANMWAAVLCNLPTLVPTALSFGYYHHKHHAYLGDEQEDADVPSGWEARLIGSYSLGKIFWLFFFPLFQTIRTFRMKDKFPYDRWALTNIGVQIGFTALIWLIMGPKATGYLFASFWFSVGLHPLGARWIQEHWVVLEPTHQETYSYYGSLNWLNLNIGYHNEHHDFPSVPWNLLPEIKRMAPEFYDDLQTHSSLTGLFLRFLFDQEISLFSRVVRRFRPGAQAQPPA